VKYIKAQQLLNVSNFENKHPITEKSIMSFYQYWDFKMDKYNVDKSEFVQMCCFLKCYGHHEDQQICDTVHHIYRVLNYEAITPALTLLDSIRRHKEIIGKTRGVIVQEMYDIYSDSFGVRCVWVGGALENDFDRWNEYRIDL